MGSGANVDWAVDTLASQPTGPMTGGRSAGPPVGSAIEHALEEEPTPDASLYLPYLFAGPVGRPQSAALLGLRAWHTPIHILRAVVHGVTFNHRADIEELTVGLVGFGAVGSLVARRLRGFDTRVLVCDPWADLSGHPDVRGVPLPELLREADIVFLHARLTPRTRHLLGAAELDLLAPHAVLVNTARAELVEEKALLERLVHGRIAGAGSTVQARTRAPALLADRIMAVLCPSGNQVRHVSWAVAIGWDYSKYSSPRGTPQNGSRLIRVYAEPRRGGISSLSLPEESFPHEDRSRPSCRRP